MDMCVGLFGAVFLILFIVLVVSFVYAISVMSMTDSDNGGYDVDGVGWDGGDGHCVDGGASGFAGDDDIDICVVNFDDR